MDILILLTVFQMVSLVGSYEFICPSQAHWNLRAKSMCNPTTNYTCLFDINLQINVYRDRCYRPSIVGPGYKYVFQPNLNRAACSYNRYQPFIFETVGYSDCSFQKSLCNSLGQETYENSNTRSDKTCICNTDKGYTFVRNSNNQCYCNPSTEDCSCYLGINSYNTTAGLEDIQCYDDMKMSKSLYTEDMFNVSQTIKIIEFDNYKYNLNDHLSNEYRIEAAKCVFILPLAYIVVWIVVVRIIQRWIQARSTPRKVDIVDWTDCSMTIAWFMDVPDECLSYELDHQPPGIDNLPVRTFSSKDVTGDVNGRRMYTLKNLRPETNYAFKLRSVYKDAKSHYSISKTEQTLKKAPRKFDIIDWTDRSMTIEWLMGGQDECLSYELDDRPPGTDNLPIRTFYYKDVVEGENGRQKYTLKDLLPETNYAFKLRSVYKDAKSHYSISKTKQTLKEALPEAIRKLSEEDKARYNKLMQSEKSEKRYFVRVMIVGKETVGKTCLMRRLLQEEISGVNSTDGVDIVVRRCKINIEDGEWTIGKEINDDKVGRIKRAQIQKAEKRNLQHMQLQAKNINKRHGVDMSTEEKDTTTDAEVNMDKSDDKKESPLVIHKDLATVAKVNIDKEENTNKSASSVMSRNLVSNTKIGIDKKEDTKKSKSLLIPGKKVGLEINEDTNKSSLVMPEDLMSNVFSKSAENTLLNLYALCELWDFAGQKEFYATHQAFLTSSAVYLVVADMTDDISKQGLSQCFADFRHIGEYVDFWFESIHCHRTAESRTNNEPLDPPILLVFTGKDKYKKEAEFKKRKQELDDQIGKVLGDQDTYHHLHQKFYLSNTEDTDKDFEKLRYAISESARKMKNWGNPCPLKWVLLEHLIEINKNQGNNFINFTDMTKLAKHHEIKILDTEELLLFLRFQHNVGNILFFEDIRDLIILKPQWLADAFRCLVSNRFDNSSLHHREDWTLFKRQGKISQSLITELFKLKDGSQFSGQNTNLNKVMEKLDIIVKIKSSMYYIMSSMMPSSTFDEVSQLFGILNEKCKKTSWLCFKFDFLPPSFFNHISAWFIRKYEPSTIDSGFALYRGICMLDIDGSGCEKILVTMSTDRIALQIVSFSERAEGFGSICSDIYSEVGQFIEDMKERYNVKISFELNFKCSNGEYYNNTFKYSTLKTIQECYCLQHQTAHRSEQIYLPWMKTEVENIPDHRATNRRKQENLNSILQLSEEDKISYNKLMQSEKTEQRYFVRTMIVGKESVGKTCLLRRLLKEDISDVTSTDGVDIVVSRCKINIQDGQWIIGKEIYDDKMGRIKRALNTNTEDRDTHHKQVNETQNIERSQTNEIPTDNKETATDDDKNESSSLIIRQNLATEVNVNIDKNNDTNESTSFVIPEDLVTDTKVDLDDNKTANESTPLVMPADLMSNVFSKSTENTLSNNYALCELWDFAGQKEFYATHQAFLTSSAVYLVVADMKDDISKQSLSQCFDDFKKIGEYVDFWFDSIHCHRTTNEKTSYGHIDPPILLVFTGKDNYNKADFKKREKELNDQMNSIWGLNSKYYHLHNTFYLSNKEDSDEEFEKLRYAIYKTAREMDNWGKAFPLKWILLEHLIEINKNAGKHFISFYDMSKLAKHPDINILKEEDLLLFLRFQHNVGNIIFFEDIRDLIILRPQWLADAYRCLVSDRIGHRRLYNLRDWTLFTQQGKISESLITELFELKGGRQFLGQNINLHKVMENLDILVKIENSSYSLMPSQMPSTTFDGLCEIFGIIDGKCKRTSWLCFKFEFLPPSFFNHLSAMFIRNYNPSKVDGGIALYRGICMFDIDKSGGTKIMVAMSTDTIALQVLSFSKEQEGIGSMCSNIYREVKQLIEDIKERYKVKYISLKLHFKCSDGYYFKDTFEYKKLTSEKECYCIQHKQMHQSEQLYSTWMKNEVKEIPDRTKINTTQDDKNPENKPSKEDVQDQTSVKTNLPVSVNLRKQLNIKQSTNKNLVITSCIKTGNTLVFTDCDNKRLIICNSDGSDINHILLSYKPWYITVIDSNTVAVSCLYDSTILIINISTRSITSTLKTIGDCRGISSKDNNLYVVIDRSIIHVMDLTGKVIRTIPLPSDRILDITVDRDRLICIDRTSSIYCCSLDGKIMWKFRKYEFQDLTCVTTDGEGNVYVTNERTNTVIVISDDGKQHRKLLTESDGLKRPSGIDYDKNENILVVSNKYDGNAFLFEMEKKS